MRVKQTIRIQPRTEERETEVRCEFCPAEGTPDGPAANDWSHAGFAVESVEVSCKEGESYPEFSSSEQLALDICCDCFKKKLKPWAESLGAKFRVVEENW